MKGGNQLAIYNSVAEDLNSGQPRKISANVARMGLKHGSARLQVQNPDYSVTNPCKQTLPLKTCTGQSYSNIQRVIHVLKQRHFLYALIYIFIRPCFLSQVWRLQKILKFVVTNFSFLSRNYNWQDKYTKKDICQETKDFVS